MKKTRLFCVIFCLLMIFLTSGCTVTTPAPLDYNSAIYFSPAEPKEKLLHVYQIDGENFLRLPVFEVLTDIGLTVDIQNNTILHIKQENSNYCLDLSENTFYESGAPHINLLTQPSQTPTKDLFLWVKNELVIPDFLIEQLIKEFGWHMEIPYENHVFFEKFEKNAYYLIVLDDSIPTDFYMYRGWYKTYAEVPLVLLLQKIGANFLWQNNTQATVDFQDKRFLLDIQEKTFKEIDKQNNRSFDLGVLLPGGYIYEPFPILEKELLVHSYHARDVLNYLGFDLNICYKNRTVTVDVAPSKQPDED